MDGMKVPDQTDIRICCIAQEYGLFRNETDDYVEDITELLCKEYKIWYVYSTWRTTIYKIVERYPKEYWADLRNVKLFVLSFDMVFNKIQSLMLQETGMKLWDA